MWNVVSHYGVWIDRGEGVVVCCKYCGSLLPTRKGKSDCMTQQVWLLKEEGNQDRTDVARQS